MPALANHQSATVTKLLLMGDSGSGKTGALASLAAAGYNLRILDFDNGIDALFNYLSDPKSAYPKEALARVHYRTLTEPMRNVMGRLIPAKATVWQETTKMLDHWKEPAAADGTVIDLGKISTWGSDDVLVIDSLTMLSNGAMNFHLQMNGALGGIRTANEHRRDIGAAQDLMERLLQLLYDSSIKCNVVVISHITYVSETGATPMEGESTPMKGFPSALGRALSPRIPRYFNSMLLVSTQGAGAATKHKIFTQSQGLIAAKTSAPLKVLPSYPIETGLADYFKAVRS